jgi:cellulose synthase/poly-beta-1,6-N-acetylglucosamine synthase-like glycosyltransferase
MAIEVSIIITAYQEPSSIITALNALWPQIDLTTSEILVICPDDETARACQIFASVKILRDSGQGKPAALNLGLEAAQGEIIILTDGDVYVAPDSLHNLLSFFDDPLTGAVSGRPISLNPRTTMLGYWSHLLTDAGAHRERSKRDAESKFFVCSGYLYAIRLRLLTSIPVDTLADDAVISHIIGEQGYRTRYSENAYVYVNYPTTYHDWLLQKIRSAGGYVQPIIANSPLRMRSFWHEAVAGFIPAFSYAHTPQEFVWTMILLMARLHLWLLILWQVQIQKKTLQSLWQRVESTK